MAKKFQASQHSKRPLSTGTADPCHCCPSYSHLFSRVTLQNESHIGLLTATVTCRNANMRAPSLVTERAAQKFARKTRDNRMIEFAGEWIKFI